MSKRTPGPWALRGYQIRADAGIGPHVATYQINIADGRLIAAAPEMFEMLLGACTSLDAAENASRSHCTADHIRACLARLGLIRLGKDEYGHESEREDPADTDPDGGVA
jgi:hypothetical protein